MEDTEKLIGIPVGQPISQLHAVACSALIGVTMLLGFPRAIAFYQRLGFNSTGESEIRIFMERVSDEI